MACNKLFRNSRLSLSRHFHRKFTSLNKPQVVFELSTQEVTSVNCGTFLRRYSVFSARGSFHRVCILQPHLSSINTVLFLSTESNDKFHIVVTNPLQSSTSTEDISPGILNIPGTVEASSVVEHVPSTGDISDSVSAITSITDLSNISANLGNEIQTVTQLVEPSLASLDLAHWTPVGLVQMILEYLHISLSMPWWGAIVTSTVITRILLIPLLIKTQRNALKMSNLMPQLQYLQSKFGEARKSGNNLAASRYAMEIQDFMKKNNLSPLKNALIPLMQAPVYISFFLGLRGMAKAPVHSMMYGGIFWATDLTVPDPYYILPLISCTTLYVVLKIGAESGVKLENLKMAKYFMQAIPVIALPFVIHFPAAVLYYWVTTNFCTLALVSILRIKPVRQFLDLPTQKRVDPKFILPKKGFISGVKEAYEDQKVLSTIQERRRMDEMRFLKAGTGPIPRTYSYDPTKPRPANAAAIAKQKEVMSAKERSV